MLSRALVLLAMSLSLGCRGGGGESLAPIANAERPPVILISIDTLRADRLPAYGYKEVETPAIDRLRAESILFSRAYTSVPLTLPAHVSLLTGLAPYQHGVRDNIGYRFQETSTPTLASRLRQLGYRTVGAVSAYVLRGRTGLDGGFDEYDDGVEYGASRALGDLQRAGPATVAAVRSWLADAGTEPFFLFVHLFEPHTPYEPPEPFRSLYSDPYDGEIAAADAAVGELLELLRHEGIFDRALIFLASDHGEGLGDHGELEHGILLYREAIQVPLIVKLPGGTRGGETVDSPVQLLDVVPTVLDVLGISKPPELLGRSLIAPESKIRNVYAETYYPRIHLGWSELRSLVTERFQYIEAPRPELYDLILDPGQSRDVLREHRGVARTLRDELQVIASDFQGPGAMDSAEAAGLRALGYLTSPAPSTASRPVDPKDALPALREMGEAFDLAAEGQCDQATEILDEILDRYPNMMDARTQLASCLEHLGLLDEALAEYSTILRESPQLADEILVELGKILLRQRRLEEAEQHAEAALEGLPSEGHQLLTRVGLARGDLDQALSQATAAVRADRVPSPDAVLLLANVYVHRGELDLALAVLEDLRQRVSSELVAPVPTLDYVRGNALARMDRAEEAERAFLSEIESFPDHSRAYADLAFLYASEGRFDLVDPLLQAMVEAIPSPESFDLAASVLENLGDTQGAARWRRRPAG